jgi:hypothetical protein
MPRFSHALWLLLPAATLGGCPVYPDACASSEDCDFGYACHYPSGQCVALEPAPSDAGPPRCRTTEDCDEGLVCDRYSRCVTEGGEAGMGGAAGSGAGTGGDGGASGG